MKLAYNYFSKDLDKVVQFVNLNITKYPDNK